MKISTQKSAQKGSDLGFISKVGIFAASLLTAASAIYIYSPVNGTNATSTTKNTIEGAISPVASVTLSANDLNIPITPTEAGAFDSKSITATVRTNSIKGYDLYFSAVDDSTDMTSLLTDSVISSDFSGTVTGSSMGANKWGYSLNNTDFLKVPALSSQTKIKSVDHYPSDAELNTTVSFGIKVSNSIPSGHYSKKCDFLGCCTCNAIDLG